MVQGELANKFDMKDISLMHYFFGSRGLAGYR
jgi:hypothetical protein